MTEEMNNCGILCFTDTLQRENKCRNETSWNAAAYIPPLTALGHLPSPLKVWLITLRSDLEQGTSSRVASAAQPPALGLITSLLLCAGRAWLCTYRSRHRRDLWTCQDKRTRMQYMSISLAISYAWTRARTLGTYENRIIKAHHPLCSPGTHPHARRHPCRIMLLKCARATCWYGGARALWYLHEMWQGLI